MTSKKLFSFLLIFSIMLSGCGGNDKTATPSEPSDTQNSSELAIDENNPAEDSEESEDMGLEKQEETSSSTKNESSSNSSSKTDSSSSKDSGKNNSSSKPSNNSSSSSSKPSGNSGNSSASKPTPAPCAHSWKDQYKTVHHEAQYRTEPVYKDEIVYEDRPVYKWQAYWTCTECGQRFDNEKDAGRHAVAICGGGYSAHKEQIQTGTEKVQVGTNKVQVGTKQVLVKEAWDEQVKTGSVCTKCNAHK